MYVNSHDSNTIHPSYETRRIKPISKNEEGPSCIGPFCCALILLGIGAPLWGIGSSSSMVTAGIVLTTLGLVTFACQCCQLMVQRKKSTRPE